MLTKEPTDSSRNPLAHQLGAKAPALRGRTALAPSALRRNPVLMSATAMRATTGAVTFRPFATDADWWAIRELLVRTYAAAPVEWNWDIRHWDGSRAPAGEAHLSNVARNGIGMWESSGRLVGAAHSEDAGDAFFQLDPDFRDVLPDMVAWAEHHLSTEIDGRRTLTTFVLDYDLVRAAVLRQRGYEQLDQGGWIRLVRFGRWTVPDDPVAAPYVMRTTTEQTLRLDAQRMADLHNVAFGRTQHSCAEYMRFVSLSPSFRHDLNLVAQAPDGHFAAHVGVTFDPVNRHGIFEPVCADPRDQRHGLARALIHEGMRRLRREGAVNACVETGDRAPANELYRACGFTEEYRGHWWKWEL
jgi:mycothiol synthase